MFLPASKSGYSQPLEKIQQKTLAYGDKTLMAEFRLAAGAILPRHSHPHEQTGYLVSGEIELTIGGQSYRVMPGDSWSISGGIEHNAVAHADSVAIEVFAPLREDYLPEQPTGNRD